MHNSQSHLLCFVFNCPVALSTGELAPEFCSQLTAANMRKFSLLQCPFHCIETEETRRKQPLDLDIAHIRTMHPFLLLTLFLSAVSAFVTSPSFVRRASLLNSGETNIETLEFRIFPDGRVEEVVRGVKGVNCNKVTEDINAVLGKVVDSQPTEELFQQDLTLNNEIQVSDGSWEGSSW